MKSPEARPLLGVRERPDLAREARPGLGRRAQTADRLGGRGETATAGRAREGAEESDGKKTVAWPKPSSGAAQGRRRPFSGALSEIALVASR